jgi:AcrR family transcriptional regulator
MPTSRTDIDPAETAAVGASGEAPTAARRPGRPRDARADDAILDAAIKVLADQGPSRFTVDAVAARAGVGKATIYRRWPSRAALLLDTAHHRIGLQPEDPDSGSVADDMVAVLVDLGRKLRETHAGRVLPVVMSEAAVNPEMRTILAAFVADRRRLPTAIIERGVARGELPRDTDVDLLLDVLGGTVFFRVLLSDAPVDEPVVRRAVETVLAGFRATPA